MHNSISVPLAMDGFESEEIDAIINSFKSGFFTMGKEVSEFESQFAEFIGSKFAVMVNSGSSANLLALEVLVRQLESPEDWKDKYVAVPAVLWPTSIWPIIQLGLRALVIDTLPGSLEIDFQQIREAKDFYKDQLVGAIVIHPLGKSLDLDEISNLRRLGMFVIEDNAESLGAGKEGLFAGTVGNFGTFSFYFSHHVTTVEGGMVVTNDYEYANHLLSMRAHGWTRNRLDKREIETKYPHMNPDFLFVTSGFNFRPMEFQGAVGKIQLSKFTNFVVKRIENAMHIFEALKGKSMKLIGGENIGNFEYTIDERTHSINPVQHSWMALPILNTDEAIDVTSIQEKLRKRGIDSRPLLAGNFSKQPAWKNSQMKIFNELKNSQHLYQNSFMVGNHHSFSNAQVEHLCEVFNDL